MSYSFSVTAGTKMDATGQIREQFDAIVASQPRHAADKEAAVVAAQTLVRLLDEPSEGDEIYVNMSGSLGWRHDGGAQRLRCMPLWRLSAPACQRCRTLPTLRPLHAAWLLEVSPVSARCRAPARLCPGRKRMKWDEWRGSMDGRPSMLIKRLVTVYGFRLDLHKFIRPDDEGCLHTHPAYALRFILWGGYEEELEDGLRRVWKPLRVGLVRPSMCHRVCRLLHRTSFSLWLRGPKIAQVRIVGGC